MHDELGVLNRIPLLLNRQRRLIAAMLLVVFLVGIFVAANHRQNGAGTSAVVAAGPANCHLDPIHLPPPPKNAANYLHTCGSQIYDAQGRLVRITGVSWFGLETATMAPDGLWARNWQTILAQLSALGYNTLRLPFSDDILQPNARPSGIDYLLNPDLQGLTSLQVMDKIIAGARQYGLRVILDRHRPSSAGQSDLWYTPQRSEAQWIAEWKMLAGRYRGDDTVIGADLDNEPRGPATWGTNDPATDWRLAAERAGNAILSVNPYWLIFVEGIEHTGNDWYWWGGDLEGVAKAPVILNLPNRVVYSPHDYGPDVYPQGWFHDSSFPNNMPLVWDKHWGYIAEQGIAPVVLGEFGGRSVGSDKEGQWQRALVSYLADHHLGFISWALNPDSGDTGGLLDDNWMTVVSAKQDLYSESLAPRISPASAQASQRLQPLRVIYHSIASNPGSVNASFIVTVFNDTSQHVPLSQLTLRYWFAGNPHVLAAVVDWAALGNGHVHVVVKAEPRAQQGGYVEIQFDSGAGDLAAFGTTGPILVRYHRVDWAAVDPSHDFSYLNSNTDLSSSRIDLYQNGRLVWGTLP